VLNIQNGAGVTHTMNEGLIIEKLVAMEEASVKYKISREEERVCQ
jgi:hypothetical protein